jgi:hypothetical protein
MLVALGMRGRAAVEAVRRCRRGTIQTWQQERFVLSFQVE